MYIYKIEMADRCGVMLSRIRNEAGISRRKMSEAIHISESTIKAWEAGQGSPSLSLLMEWFRVVGEGPFSYLLEFYWPDTFSNLSPASRDADLRNAFLVYLREVAGAGEILKLHYLIYGSHGSSWDGLVEMFCAHVHTSLKCRYKIADIIHTSFEISAANHQLTVPQTKLLDIALLDEAIYAAHGATLSHKQSYIVSGRNEHLKEVSSIIMKKARIEAGVPHSYLAKALGKTERTVRKWEVNTEASFLDLCSWFHILGKPMWSYLRSELFLGETVEFSEKVNKANREISRYFSTCPMAIIRKMNYMIFAKHGSNWQSLLEMMVEHVMSPMTQRVISERSVLIGYQMDHNDKQSRENQDSQPNLENLEACIRAETEAAKAGSLSQK